VKELNRKALVLAFMLLAILALTVVPAYAGKGQTKMDFNLRLEGLPDSTTGEMRVTKNNFHVRGRSWNILKDFFVQVGTEDPITKPYLEYSASMYQIGHYDDSPLGYWFTVKVQETISIYNDPVTHDKTTLRGTLEILALGDNPAGNGATFTGHGTGEFECVKVKGTTAMSTVYPPPFLYLQLDRTGTVMGWPTP
jgi:hypothetical protein